MDGVGVPVPLRRVRSLSHVPGDAVAVRDRVVRWMLGCGAVAALLTWYWVGAWPALAVVLLALVGASVVYRIEPPTIHLDAPSDDDADRERSRSRAADRPGGDQ